MNWEAMSIQYSEVLQTIAEVSITFAGFIGLILVIRNNARTNRMEANEMFHMLLSSLGVCGAALLPLIVQAVFVEEALVWRLCTPLLGLLHFLGAARGLNDLRKGELGMPVHLMLMFAPGSCLIFSASMAVVAGYWIDHAPAIYLVGLGWALLVSAAAFLTLVFKVDEVEVQVAGGPAGD